MDYETHLKELREIYYRSYPAQRLKIAKESIENPEHGPNLLVTHVSAIEGILRSLVVWLETTDTRPSSDTYESYRKWGVDALYRKYCALKGVGEVAPEATYKLVSYAVEYRNLLAHECTYLGQDKYPELIDACKTFLSAVTTHANIANS